MWMFQLELFCCECQKTQRSLALGLLAQVPGECRGESGFQAGPPVGTERISFRTWFLSISQFCVLLWQLHFEAGLPYVAAQWRPHLWPTSLKVPVQEKRGPTSDVTISRWPWLDTCLWLTGSLKYRNAELLPTQCRISHLGKSWVFKRKHGCFTKGRNDGEWVVKG